ncbi:MAG: helix-turn-helix domain-containing protein [Eubacteriales bacterium]
MVVVLGENIRRMRQASGISQVEFARRLGVTKQCVSNWENDNVVPSVEMLVRIADIFHVSTDSLLGRQTEHTLNTDYLTDTQRAHIALLVEDLVQINTADADE